MIKNDRSVPASPSQLLSWDAFSFFSDLCARNRLCREYDFRVARCSSLDGFQAAIAEFQNATALMAIDEESDGSISLNNSAHSHFVKTVFLSMRHAEDNPEARRECFAAMREIVRQFLSSLIREKTRIEQGKIYIEPTITLHEIPQYFFNGAACAYFNVTVGIYPDLIYRKDEWTE